MCAELHRLARGLRRHRFPFDPSVFPRNGIYLLFEDGEGGHDGDRIVRVGTHTGPNQLRSRVQQHFIKENKDRSIFRKHIGRALLRRDGDPLAPLWELDLTAAEARKKNAGWGDQVWLAKIEKLVTARIQQRFSFVVLEVPEKEERLRLESRLISTVSLCEECCASPGWLGLMSPKERIRESGLWLINELYKEPLSEDDMTHLRRGGA